MTAFVSTINRKQTGRPDEAQSKSRFLADLIAATAVVILLYIGFFKGSTSLQNTPVDLTAASLALVSCAVAFRLVQLQGRSRIPLWSVALFALYVPPAFYSTSNPLAIATRLRLIIPVVAVIGTCMLINSERRQKIWVGLHVLVGIGLVGSVSLSGVRADSRFQGDGSNTIAAGRASGVAIVVLLLLLCTRGGLPRIWMKLIGLVTIGWLTVALIQTGSRGPVLACAVSVLLVLVTIPSRRRTLRFIFGLSAIGAGWLFLVQATGIGATRITESLGGQYSLTGSRQQIWAAALTAIPQNPVGIGWGNFWAILTPASRLQSGYNQYPHNVVMQVFIEAGWLAGIATIFFIVVSLHRLQRMSTSPYGAALFGIAMFFVLNGLVSGDLNDNRMMWAALAIAWVARSSQGHGLPITSHSALTAT